MICEFCGHTEGMHLRGVCFYVIVNDAGKIVWECDCVR